MDPRPPTIHRTISYALQRAREREESETLLGEEDITVDGSGFIAPASQRFYTNQYSDLPVYKNIHRYVKASRKDVTTTRD
jgi:hypothetical protein